MRYELDTAHSHYNDDEKNKLKKLGFTFRIDDDPYYDGRPFVICSNKQIFIDINSLQELQSFVYEFGPIIMEADSITIYDGNI